MGYSHTFRCVIEFIFSIPLFFRNFYQATKKEQRQREFTGICKTFLPKQKENI